MHTDEMWQLYKPNGEPIVGEGWPSCKDNPVDETQIVGAAIVFIYRKNREGQLEFLWQKRSDKVSSYPGKFDFSAGGHINLGESLIEATLREAHEEIGAKIMADDLMLLTMVGYGKNRFGWVYLVDFTGKPEEFEFDDGEVSEIRWVPYAGMDVFRKKYAKKSIVKDEVTFTALDEWLRARELV